MKKKLLILLCLLSLSAFAQTTLIPDQNFEQKLISLGLDTVLDGKVLTSNISSVTSLDVSSSSIKSLRGLHAFTNLETLNCSNNEIIGLDFPNNPKLSTLICHSNKIQSLDVSKNPRLQNLDCQSNEINYLDISQNTFLTQLNCSKNKLSSLNTSKNLSLKGLYCSDNILNSLDLSGNTLLTELNCNNNRIKSLTISDNTGLIDLYCENNRITTLDLSKQKELKNVNLKSNDLVNLNIKNGNNTSLNVNNLNLAHNPQLLCIQVDNVMYSSTNWEYVKDLQTSYSTDCPNYTVIPDTNFENALIALGIDSGTPDKKVLTSNISTVTTLDLGINTTIADLTGIQDFTALQTLICHGNTGQVINGGNGKLKILDISKNVNLTTLDCSYNQLINLDVTNNPLLVSLNCNVNKLTKIDVSKNVKLNNLDISSNQIIQLDLSKIPTLRYLSADDTKLTYLDISSNPNMVGLFCNNSDLRSLNLKNGNNQLISAQDINFKGNPNLNCIQVDNAVNATTNWSAAKDPAANYSTECVNDAFTIIPDSNFENALITLGIDAGVPDGKILTSKVSSVTKLDLGTNTTITDLTGIQDFKALEWLVCQGNTGRAGDGGNGKLKTLDVSKNTNLTILECSFNQLTNLDVTHNPLLRSLRCSVNKLTAIDVSQNTKLDDLDVGSNQITTLDVSKIPTLRFLTAESTKLTTLDLSSNPALVGLFCRSSDLTSLNLRNGKNQLIVPQSITFTGNPNLTCIQVDDAAFSTANWSAAKDASAIYSNQCQTGPYTLIPDSNFESALISLGIDSGVPDGKVLTSNVSSVTKLDLGTNATITDLTGIQDFTALQRLICHGNFGHMDTGGNGKLTTIDVTKNTKLIALDISYNKITALDVSKNPLLISLKCSVNKLTKIDVSQNIKLDNLDISNNYITQLDISKIPTLRYLSADYTKLTALDISSNPVMVGLFCNNSTLTSLNLKNGQNQLIAAQSINFKENPNLTCIQVDNAVNSNANWSAAKDASANYSNECQTGPYTLIPDSNFENALISLGIDSGVPDGKVLTSNVSSVTKLDLGTNATITDLTGIQDFTALQWLICHGNFGHMDTGGNGKLTTIDVSKNTKLTVLDVSFNKITNLDVTNNPLLISLSCNVNKLTAINVSKNTKLDNLNISNNHITQLDISKIPTLRYLSAHYTKLTALDISSNPVMVGLFCNNSTLTSLNLKNGRNQLIAAQSIDFKENPNLTCIQVDNAVNSTANWSAAKDASANYSNECQTVLYTLIPDSNFEKKLILLGIDSGTPDGRVLTSSVKTVTSLDVSLSNITDLTGLEDFTSLTSLKCQANYTLKALDVTKNIHLTTLDCSNNYLITTLDVSKNTALVDLNCYYNKLNTLDVSSNTNLTTLQCSSNKLTNLNVSNNKALTKLDLGYNLVSNLDVSQNTKLTSLTCTSNQISNLNISLNTKLTELWAGNNKYDVLDVSNNTALTSLICNTNQLTSIDVSKNTALTRLLVYQNKITSIDISNNPLLSSFDCNSNLITNLNVSKNIDLNFLYCDNNKLTVLDVSANTKLGTFDCANNLLTNLDVSNNKNLRSLECESNKLVNLNLKNGNNYRFDPFPGSDPNFILYRIDFRNNPDLTCIQVDDAYYSNEKWSTRKDPKAKFSEDCNNSTLITDSNFEDFLIAAGIDTDGKNGKVATSSIANIKVLDISNSNISDLKGIENFTALEKFICKGNLITTVDMSNNTQLNYLDVSNNPLTSVNVSKNKLLKEFYCNGIQIILKKSTSTSSRLTTLDVSNNTLLTNLNCSNNQLSSLDLSKNTNLIEVNCSNNLLTDLNLQSGNNGILVNLNLKNNTQLTCIKVDNPSFSTATWTDAKDEIAKYSSTCRTLETNEQVFNNINIYPNPSHGELYITNVSVTKATIYDSLGKLVKVVSLKGDTQENYIDLKGIAQGVYYIFIENPEAHTVKKIIIK
ncbi:T9SS type A sorting domain-containing protein [Flavobacterium tructae]|uniref:T9SS type A sorting domain-containing protein n=1 Tax=Flavobacterium tructae TaxID=1114873 RepID=UPI002551F3A1|nr:T9SS type A sorting domain-containing protein [Flavobacterium tructae]MDL2145391.1 T9SS type A sorting domain-containing protein [Flavobacterium tructae]